MTGRLDLVARGTPQSPFFILLAANVVGPKDTQKVKLVVGQEPQIPHLLEYE